jgi:hypothetical protein
MEPPLHEGWHRSIELAVETATSHLFLWNHLAAVRQVGEGASLRRDALLIWGQPEVIASQGVNSKRNG